VTFNVQAGTATPGLTGTFTSIESFIGNGATTTLIGSSGGATYNLTGTNSGTLNGSAFSGIGNITAGSGADTFTGTAGGSLQGNLNDGGGATTLFGTQTYSGAVTITATTAITAGSSLTFGSTVTGSTFNFTATAGSSLATGTMNVGSGVVTLTAGTLLSGASVKSTTSGTLSSGANVAGLFVDFQSLPLTLTGNASTWNLSGPGGATGQPTFQVTNSLTNIIYNGGAISGAVVVATQQSGSIIGSTLAEIAKAALQESQDTDSVAKQIQYGFAGDVGTTPPMNHQIDDTGISVPVCFNESRDGQTCR
jgi:hypothetical protein